VRYFEDFAAGEAIELGSHTVNEASILEFARAYDPQVFHVDPVRARQSIFGGLIASGWHTSSIFMRLLVDGVLGDAASLASPGVDELRWLVPVRPGDTLRGQLTIVDVRPSHSRGDRGIVRSRGELFNQDGQLVLSVLATNFIGRRPV
jgi:acyl dehydratase